MSGKIIASDFFKLSPERIKELEGHGATMVHQDPLKGIDIKPINHGGGEIKVGDLTHDEAVIFRALYDLKRSVDTQDRAMQGKIMAKMAEAVAAADPDDGPIVKLDGREIMPSLEDDEIKDYFFRRQQAGYLHAMLHYTLGQRLDLHHWGLGVRAGGAVVKIEARQPGV